MPNIRSLNALLRKAAERIGIGSPHRNSAAPKSLLATLTSPTLRYHGHLDLLRLDGRLYGWAIDSTNPFEPALLDVFLNGRIVQSVECVERRADVKAAGFKSEFSGFSTTLKELKHLDENSEVSIRFAGTNIDLGNSPLKPTLLQESKLQRYSRFYDERWYSRTDVPGKRRRLAIFAIFNDTGRLSLAQRNILLSLSENDVETVVINSSLEFKDDLESEIRPLANCYVSRENGGRDFFSWLAFYIKNKNYCQSFEDVMFLNDSISGPIFPLRELLEARDRSNCDFWALSDSYQSRYHLQTSVFFLNKKALASNEFRRFISQYSFSNDKSLVVHEGEINLTQLMQGGDHSIGALCSYNDMAKFWLEKNKSVLGDSFATNPSQVWLQTLERDILAGRARNAQHVFWDTMIEARRYPFIKNELFAKNPDFVPNLSRIFDLEIEADQSALGSMLNDMLDKTPGGAPIANL